MRAKDRRGILPFDPVLLEVAQAARAEGDGSMRYRANHQQANPGMFGQLSDEARMQLLELIHGQTVIVAGEPDQSQVARADHGDRGLVGGVRDLLVVEVDHAVVVFLARAARATVGPTPWLRVISERKELTKVDPSALVVVSMTVARPLIRSRTTSPRLCP